MECANLLGIAVFFLYLRAEREKYYEHGLKGKKDPDKYLSLIIDGMDQSKQCLSIRKQQNITNIRHLPSYFALKMSDNESFESHTDTEESTDNEDIAEQSSVVQPYQFEPVADSDYEEDQTDEDGILPSTLEARFKKDVAVNS